eukprot:SAG11_NODE_8902_length_964_cov_2.080925_1_plen_112_part_01
MACAAGGGGDGGGAPIKVSSVWVDRVPDWAPITAKIMQQIELRAAQQLQQGAPTFGAPPQGASVSIKELVKASESTAAQQTILVGQADLNLMITGAAARQWHPHDIRARSKE